MCKRDGITDRRTDKRTNGQTDRRTDDPITRCSWRTFQAGGIKISISQTQCYIKIYSKVQPGALEIVKSNCSKYLIFHQIIHRWAYFLQLHVVLNLSNLKIIDIFCLLNLVTKMENVQGRYLKIKYESNIPSQIIKTQKFVLLRMAVTTFSKNQPEGS